MDVRVRSCSCLRHYCYQWISVLFYFWLFHNHTCGFTHDWKDSQSCYMSTLYCVSSFVLGLGPTVDFSWPIEWEMVSLGPKQHTNSSFSFIQIVVQSYKGRPALSDSFGLTACVQGLPENFTDKHIFLLDLLKTLEQLSAPYYVIDQGRLVFKKKSKRHLQAKST